MPIMSLWSNLVNPQSSIVSIDLLLENLQTSVSKANRWILIKLHTQHYWELRKVAYCFWADWTGTVVAMTRYRKKIFSETTGPTALVFVYIQKTSNCKHCDGSSYKWCEAYMPSPACGYAMLIFSTPVYIPVLYELK